MASLTVNPGTGSGGTTMDGHASNGYAASWASVRSTPQGDGVGGYNFNPTDAYMRLRALRNGTGYYCDRNAASFDTSSLGAGATIVSAVLSFYGNTTNFSNPSSTSMEIVGFTPANLGTFVDADWTQFGSTAFATGIAFSSLNQSGWNDFTLNSSGLAAINKTGVTAFGIVSGLDFSNTAPGFGADNIFEFQSAEGANKPKLVVTYTVGGVPFTKRFTQAVRRAASY